MKENFKMKSLLIIFCLTSGLSFCQNVKFNYDVAGNRIERLKVYKSSQVGIADTIINQLNDKNNVANFGDVTIRIYPNPTTCFIQIECDGLLDKTVLEATLVTTKGVILKRFKIYNENKTIEMENYPSGLYFLQISFPDKVEQWKIVKN